MALASPEALADWLAGSGMVPLNLKELLAGSLQLSSSRNSITTEIKTAHESAESPKMTRADAQAARRSSTAVCAVGCAVLVEWQVGIFSPQGTNSTRSRLRDYRRGLLPLPD